MVFEDGHNDYSQAGFARSINVFYGKLIRLESKLLISSFYAVICRDSVLCFNKFLDIQRCFSITQHYSLYISMCRCVDKQLKKKTLKPLP